MNLWSQAPIVRLLIPFIVGILFAIFSPTNSVNTTFIVCGMAVLFSFLVYFGRLRVSYKRSWIFGLLINWSLFLFAFQLTISNTEQFSDSHFSKHTTPNGYAHVRLNEPCHEKEKSLKVTVDVLNIKQNSSWVKANGKALVYFEKGENAFGLKYGDEIIVKTTFRNVPPPQNPGEFNYKQFLQFHNIAQQAFVKKENWAFTNVNTASFLRATSVKLRNSLLNVLSNNNIKGDEFAVGSALLLGYKDMLDTDIVSAYSSSGAMHILSVSGLHVGIVYLVFTWLLSILGEFPKGDIIKAVLMIAFLWFYALLTGLSPSVLRAATMFTFIVVAKAYNRHSNIYNTLAASAFLLLLFDPFLIMNVGFQLSYIAVIGIVYMHPKINSWFAPKTWLMENVWSIASVSIAAQIATLPLALFYFHKFPNYFLLTNLFVIPLSSVIIYLGISIFVMASFTAIATYLSLAFSWFVALLNKIVFAIENLPYSIIDGINISVIELFLIYGLIVSSLCYFVKYQFRFLLISLSLMSLLVLFQIVEQHRQLNQKKIIVYNISHASAIDFISSNNNVLYTDSSFVDNKKKRFYRVEDNWQRLGITHSIIESNYIQTNNLHIKDGIAQFYDKKIAFIKAKNSFHNNIELSAVKSLSVDYLIISNNINVSLVTILQRFNPTLIIFDSSNSYYRVKEWEKECERLRKEYHSVLRSGAFMVNL